MRHRSKKKILGRKPSARKALMRDLAQALITHERIETSLGRAKYARPIIEKLITVSRRGDLSARRFLKAFFLTDQPVEKLMDVLGPRFKDRNGGYIRITKLGTRQGDRAETALIELV
ncbi:MAG: 50S ribosomal protein L17 [Patescibacteria group bacterium]